MANYYFLDTEFLESGSQNPIELISIGIVKIQEEMILRAVDGKKTYMKNYYAVSSDFDEEKATDWLKENVMPNLNKTIKNTKSLEQIKDDVIKFVGEDENPIFVAYYADYDWVVFSQIFGAMIDLPKNFPMFCVDFKQILMTLGNPEIPKNQSFIEHNALNDALDLFGSYLYLLRKIKDQKIEAKDLLLFKN